jgi:RNA-binding protein FUS
MEDFFSKIGYIKFDNKAGQPKIWIYKDKATGLPKGDATLTWDDEETAERSLEWFNGVEFLGQKIKVEMADYYDWMAKKGGQRGRGRGRGGGY